VTLSDLQQVLDGDCSSLKVIIKRSLKNGVSFLLYKSFLLKIYFTIFYTKQLLLPSTSRVFDFLREATWRDEMELASHGNCALLSREGWVGWELLRVESIIRKIYNILKQKISVSYSRKETPFFKLFLLIIF